MSGSDVSQRCCCRNRFIARHSGACEARTRNLEIPGLVLRTPRNDGWREFHQADKRCPTLSESQMSLLTKISTAADERSNGSAQSAARRQAPRSNPLKTQKAGLLRRFRLRSLSYGGQVAPRNDGVLTARAASHSPSSSATTTHCEKAGSGRPASTTRGPRSDAVRRRSIGSRISPECC